MTTQNITTNATIATDNADLIFEAAKRLKAAKGRLGNKGAKEQEARDTLKALQIEANAITTAMVNDEDDSEMRDLSDVQRDLRSANTKLDRALERAHDDKDAVVEALNELAMFLEGSEPKDTVNDESDGENQEDAA